MPNVDSSVLPQFAQDAIAAFAAAPVGQQLAEVEECRGRCAKASQRFVHALEHHGTGGTVLEFYAADGTWFHQVVMVDGFGRPEDGSAVIVDWTVRQFDEHANEPYPRLETVQQAFDRWGKFNPIARHPRYFGPHSPSFELGPWSVARERIPPSSSPANAPQT